MSCVVEHRRGLDPVLLWLWFRPMAIAPIRLLAWERPHAAGAAQEKAKRQKKKNKKEQTVCNCIRFLVAQNPSSFVESPGAAKAPHRSVPPEAADLSLGPPGSRHTF